MYNRGSYCVSGTVRRAGGQGTQEPALVVPLIPGTTYSLQAARRR